MNVELPGDAVIDGVIQGHKIAALVRAQVREQVERLAAEGISLRLVVVRVGHDPASEIYVRYKQKACREVGIDSEQIHLPEDVSQATLVERLLELNDDPEVDGILVQLPLPSQIDADRVTEVIDAKKDVDGFHPQNLGLLLGRDALLQPCTAAGIMLLLRAAETPIDGADATVVGRSMIVGRPTAQLLLRANATTTICHRRTRDLRSHVERADILVVATGVPGLIPGAWIKEGATVIDVGINRLPSGKVVGDVDFEGARKRARAISPVPRGVGPMTIAMLLWNTVLAGTFRRTMATDGPAQPLTPFLAPDAPPG